MKNRVYLDYNATGVPRPEVVEAMADILARGGNPSSVHAGGREARAEMEKARSKIAAVLNCKTREITFTSGGTESNNMALRAGATQSLIIGATEHDSILAAAQVSGKPAAVLPVHKTGLVDMASLRQALADSEGPALVSIMLANNETGVIQPLQEIADAVHAAGGLLHTDAVQALGKIPVDFKALDVDLMTVNAHKLGGPHGVGALVIRESVIIPSLIVGGGQELGRRAGTENLAGIVGFAKAVELAVVGLVDFAGLAVLRDRLETDIRNIAPDARVFGKSAARLANTSCFAVPGLSSETQVMAMDLAGFCISAGSACSSGKVKPSHVVTAMGADDAHAGSAIRVSLGWTSTAEDVDNFVAAWTDHYQRSWARSGAHAGA